MPTISHFGRYRIVEELAAGGMATVYKAVYSGLSGFEKHVALKVMHTHLAKDAHHRSMFEDEARTGALLHHRCIVETLDFGSEQHLPFLASEFLDGWTLEKALEGRKCIPGPLGLFLLAELLDALSYAHSLKDEGGKPLGLVHRDISPQNIFLTRDGRVKLIDFGIAWREGRAEETKAGILKGKFRYMAPEQAGGAKVSGGTDVYSAALVVYSALVGRKPHLEAQDTRQMILAAQEGLKINPGEMEGICPGLGGLFGAMLDKDPAQRPSAGKALEQLLGLLRAAGMNPDHRTLAQWLAREEAGPKPRKRRPKEPEQRAGEAPERRRQPEGSDAEGVMGPVGLVVFLAALFVLGFVFWIWKGGS